MRGAGQYGYLHTLLFESFATQDGVDIVCNVVPDGTFIAIVCAGIGDKCKEFVCQLFFMGKQLENVGHGIGLSCYY